MSDTFRNTIAYSGSKEPEVALRDKTANKFAKKEKHSDHKFKRSDEKRAIQSVVKSGDNESLVMPNHK